MATVGSLFINVKARTASFSKKMKGVRGTITRMATGFVGLAVKVAKFAAVLGGVALAAIVAFTRAGIKSVDMLGKTADKLGLLPKHLQALRLAATSTGITVETLDMALQRMARRVGEAAVGTGEAQGALKELGLDAKALNQLSTDKVFHKISDAMEGVTNAQDRLRLAMKLFDSEGAALHVTMKGGSAALKEYARINKDLGMELEFSQVKVVEKAATKLGFLKSVWGSLGNFLAVEFAPILIKISNKIITFIKDSGGMAQVAEGIVKAFFYAGAAVLDVIRAINLGWQMFKTATLQVFADVFNFISGVVEKAETLLAEFFQFALKSASVTSGVLSWMAKTGAKGAEAMGADTVASILRTASVVTKTFEGVFGAIHRVDKKTNRSVSDWLKEMGMGLQTQADESADALLATLSEGWNLEKVPNFFKNLRDNMMGDGFDIGAGGGMQIEMVSPDMKGSVESLQTAIGGFKVEGDGQTRLLQTTLSVEQKQLQTSKEILTAITQQGGGFLL